MRKLSIFEPQIENYYAYEENMYSNAMAKEIGLHGRT